MNIYILLGNPDSNSFNRKIVETYTQEAQKKGHTVRVQYLGDMKFDPILWKGYKNRQELEPDLLDAKANILWCDKWVIVYPIWWGSVPALLKGFFDRTLHSGFAYKYHENDPFWDKLLKGRKAEIITTCDAPTWWIWWQYRNSDLHAVKNATLEFCGFGPIKVLRFGKMRFAKEADLAKYILSLKNFVE